SNVRVRPPVLPLLREARWRLVRAMPSILVPVNAEQMICGTFEVGEVLFDRRLKRLASNNKVAENPLTRLNGPRYILDLCFGVGLYVLKVLGKVILGVRIPAKS